MKLDGKGKRGKGGRGGKRGGRGGERGKGREGGGNFLDTSMVGGSIQDIPEAERRALEDLYDRCGGRSWKAAALSDGWKTGASKWHGVTVENGHVVKICLNKYDKKGKNGLIGGAFDVDVGSGEEGGVCALGLQ